MKKLTQEQLNKILEEHKHWLNKDCEGWGNMKADFSYCKLAHANLRGANLRYADLSNANLSDADLSHTDLCGADLNHANLSNANLSCANLSYAGLSYANLSHTDLCGAKLSDADLCSAKLGGADLSHTDLCSADLCSADLCGANLSCANLSCANLSYANLSCAKEVPYIPMVCPEEGDFIGWKKADDKIVKLHIPQDALRSSATTRKCRCNKAEVIAIYNLDGTEAGETTCHSDYDSSFIYEVGKTVEVTDFDEDRWNECAKGIHFFINRQEAINY